MTATFDLFALQGSSIATASFSRDAFEGAIEGVNNQFDLKVEPKEDVFLMLEDGLRVVAGRFWHEEQAIERKSVIDRLTRISENAASLETVIGALQIGFRDLRDVEAANFLSAIMAWSNGETLHASRQRLETILRIVESLHGYSDQALAILSNIPAKKGRRGLTWHDAFFELMARAAESLGIKVSTQGDRSGDPYATPFTVLVHSVESALPEEARSDQLLTCARRIDRSRKRFEAARQKDGK